MQLIVGSLIRRRLPVRKYNRQFFFGTIPARATVAIELGATCYGAGIFRAALPQKRPPSRYRCHCA